MSDNNIAAPLLTVKNLRRSFAGIHAVDGLNLQVAAGSITGIIGPNGCGKTTSINCITGFDQGYTGDVEIGGLPISRTSPDKVARNGVMRTFQAIRVFDEYSVVENALIGYQSFDRNSVWDVLVRSKHFRAVEEAAREMANTLLHKVGLSAKANDKAGSLSYGQKKLLALASTLMSKPKVVILDEPVAGVNPTLTWGVADILRDLNQSGTTFLIIEHNIQFVMALCNEVVVMDRGSNLVNGTPSEIQQDSRVVEAYLGGNAHVH